MLTRLIMLTLVTSKKSLLALSTVVSSQIKVKHGSVAIISKRIQTRSQRKLLHKSKNLLIKILIMRMIIPKLRSSKNRTKTRKISQEASKKRNSIKMILKRDQEVESNLKVAVVVTNRLMKRSRSMKRLRLS